MQDSPVPVRARPSVLPWVIVAVLLLAAGASFFWVNHKIDALEAAKAPAAELNGDETRKAVAALQHKLDEIQSGQTKETDQLNELQRRMAAEQGERKLLSDQLGSISGRVDALASSNADANANPQQPQRSRRSKR